MNINFDDNFLSLGHFEEGKTYYKYLSFTTASVYQEIFEYIEISLFNYKGKSVKQKFCMDLINEFIKYYDNIWIKK